MQLPAARSNVFAPSAAHSLKKRKFKEAAPGKEKETQEDDKKAGLKNAYLAMMQEHAQNDCRDGHRQGAVVK